MTQRFVWAGGLQFVLRSRIRHMLAAVAVASAFPVVFEASAAWADTGTAVAYQIDVAHSGVHADGSLWPPFVNSWQVTLPGLVSYPIIAQGLIFVTVGDNTTAGSTLYALDQITGQTAWSQPLTQPPPVAYPWANAAYDDGRVFAIGTAGLMSAYDAATGALLWSVILPFQYFFSAPPTAADGVVYVGGAGSGGTVYAIDQATGAVLATQTVQNGDKSSPTLSDTDVFVSYACDQAYGFAQGTLELLWHYNTFCEGGGGKTAVYNNGRVFTRDFIGNLILDADSGNLLGTYGALSAMAPAVRGNTLWMLSAGTLTAQDITAPSSPATLWSFAGDGQLVTAPIVLSTPQGDFVIEGSASGMLYALNAATGAIVWSTNVGAGIWPPDEQNVSQPLTGLGAGQGLLVVPAGKTVFAFSRVADRTAPVITVPGTITAQATSPQGAIVTYSVSATDPDDAASTPLCTPASGTLFPIGTTQVSCVSTDTNANTASAIFVVHVEGAEEELADLLFAIKQTQARTLASKAKKIEAFVAGNKQNKACNALNSFIGAVNGRVGRGLTAAQAADFSARATNIEHVLGC
jgi:outer membrane protein assembly factor BamB